ncbi:hypothetical protein [Ochrobactrum chromiisoli]|uniref:Uncharacterized protein n=1 Tax=Ochrobactrum chromiisoli TaxID=2993941 RepID=A0ABT3QL80_9HYPH|nr:hypothetical protein [Ochrobactrum chromiisoli]MCX2696363.1 hypothetical protein [Ochrobactrum chromiisoli]
MSDRPILFSAPTVATPEMIKAALDLVWEDSENHGELVRNIWGAMAAKHLSAQQYVDCACTKIQQDEHCLVGYPSLLCEICGGKGVVPYVKLDGPELWEIVFGIAYDAAHRITDEQYSKIAEAINSVFISPQSAASYLYGPFGYLNGHRALSEDSWTLESDPMENNEEYFAVPLYALRDPFKEIGTDFDGKPAVAATKRERDLAGIATRLIKWDKDFPVNCHNGYAGLKELDRIIADAKTALYGIQNPDREEL